MANFDSQDQISRDPINGSGLRCLRCDSAAVRVLREVRVASSNRFVDTRCLSCGEQSVLRLAARDESQHAAAS
jgi:RNase P subunit RPR2